MPILAAALYLIVALGLLAMAAKFAFGSVPAPHHAAVLKHEGADLQLGHLEVLRGLYLTLAGAYLGLAVLVAYLAIAAPEADRRGAALALGIAGLCAGVPSGYRTWKSCARRGIPSPWPMAAGLTTLAVVASIIASL